MEQKFEVYFVMAKKNISFTKYPALLQLEGIGVGSPYKRSDSLKYISYQLQYPASLLCYMYDRSTPFNIRPNL